ncbi:hypothetical protein BSL78_14690 [Apostichopus japonicus]|uniref:D-glutamate cyclase-like C-terminal domain-containing protein n=1 Tax=Stichopus japonicus TaxID=307972 RepID=A0A2G8KKB1_STIJA|nr:hypothetical protein BSL78_14690 [Apostichopus japonicus]
MAHLKTKQEPLDGIDLRKVPPSKARSLFREGKYFRKGTAGMCSGHLQANLVMLPSDYSQSFAQFCSANCGPLPVLFSSKPGQFDAPPLTTTNPSDIRTDLAAYAVIENGERARIVKSLEEFEEQIKDFASFYLGCSFSFDKKLLSAGVPLRNLDENGLGNTSMYTTNIWCKPVGKFNCRQVVSMRAIPAELVQTAYAVTHVMKSVHGAPIHIGNPAVIGIADIGKVDYGVPTNFESNDRLLFWCCGATGVEAVKSIKNPPLASAASLAAEELLTKLEVLASDDPGKRNIAKLFEPGELMKSALCLSHSRSVAIVTGYPAFYNEAIPFETDGPPGALALGVVLQSLGIHVTLILDPMAGFDKAMESILEKLISEGVIKKPFSLEVYPRPGHSASDLKSALDFLTEDGDITRPRFDHLVAIERPGMAADGHYYTMGAKDISHLVTNTDILFDAARNIPTTFTTAVGDGGNELGMGKFYERVRRHVMNGEIIASKVPADFVITCGVSNWGGYALCFALYALRSDVIHDRHRRRGLGFPLTREEKEKMRESLPSQKQEEAVMRVLLDHKFFDMTGKVCMSVDGLDFYDIHLPKLKDMMECMALCY